MPINRWTPMGLFNQLNNDSFIGIILSDIFLPQVQLTNRELHEFGGESSSVKNSKEKTIQKCVLFSVSSPIYVFEEVCVNFLGIDNSSN